MRVFILGALAGTVAGHGAMVIPRPRNAVDGTDAPWTTGVPWPVPFAHGPLWCPVAHSSDPEKLSGEQGQACYWFSNGCSIGCPKCDGVTRGPIPVAKEPTMECKGMHPLFPNNPKREGNCKRKMDTCGLGHNASICSAELRTYNTAATCHGPDDFYEFSPWRAPGSAPVFDSCGVAGGKPPPAGGYGAQYYNTTHASQGDHGSKVLKPAPSGIVWAAGDTVEVSWAIEANHGGGYQYRLCKADDPLGLTEACFTKTPLRFTGSTSFRWGGKANGTTENITGHFVTDTAPKADLVGNLYSGIDVVPPGSIWAQNPIPDYGSDKGAPSFPPRCKENTECGPHSANPDSSKNVCKCTGEWGPYNLEIVDHVVLPSTLDAGEYVVGFRWGKR